MMRSKYSFFSTNAHKMGRGKSLAQSVYSSSYKVLGVEYFIEISFYFKNFGCKLFVEWVIEQILTHFGLVKQSLGKT